MRTVEPQRIPTAAEAIAIATATVRLSAPEPEPQPEPETPQGLVRRLEAELSELELKAQRVSAAITAGDVIAVADYDLREMTIHSAALANDLTRAREALAATEREDERRRHEQNKQDFKRNMELAFQSRAAFQRAFATAAAALGDYCEAMKVATVLERELREYEGCFSVPDPEQMQQLSDIADRARLSPVNDLLGKGYKQTMDFGFDLGIIIPPLHAPVKEEQKQ
jgi:hypothetical protein